MRVGVLVALALLVVLVLLVEGSEAKKGKRGGDAVVKSEQRKRNNVGKKANDNKGRRKPNSKNKKKNKNKKKQAAKKRRRRNRRNRRARTTTLPPCPPIPVIGNSQPVGASSATRIQITCLPGYELVGNGVITCIGGKWTSLPVCKRTTCNAPPNIPFALAPQLSTGGNTATYMCLTGYRVFGGNGATSATATCHLPTRTWQNIPTCEKIPTSGCSAPPAIANAVSTVSGTTATYTCLAGYKLKPGTPSIIVCNSGSWQSAPLPVCESDPTAGTACRNVPGGDFYISRPAVLADSYTVGMSVTFTCKTGYRIVGSNDNTNTSAKIYCLQNGNWTTRPSCEPVDCGKPAEGTNTNSVTITNTKYDATYTYVCKTDYLYAGNLVSTCQASGKWSLVPPPTCTKKMCLSTALPDLPFSTKIVKNYNIGEEVKYTCNGDYRLAPEKSSSYSTEQTIKCQSNGTFTALKSVCVYKYPTDCKDYYRRDGLFESTSVGCKTVTIDPKGPGFDSDNPPAVQVSCCKKNATHCCSEVAPTSGTNLPSTAAACAGKTSNILPGVEFDGTKSFVCGTPTTVIYPIGHALIISLIGDSNTCQQQVSISCPSSVKADALAVKNYGKPSAFVHGASGLTKEVTTGPATYLNAVCDCAKQMVVPATCQATGCSCSADAGSVAGSSDTITYTLTPQNPQYVTDFVLTTHNSDAVGSGFNVQVEPIRCCEQYTP